MKLTCHEFKFLIIANSLNVLLSIKIEKQGLISYCITTSNLSRQMN